MAVKMVGEVRLPPEHVMSVNGVFDSDSEKHQVMAAIRRDRLLSAAEVLKLAEEVKTWQFEPITANHGSKRYKGQVALDNGTVVTISLR